MTQVTQLPRFTTLAAPSGLAEVGSGTGGTLAAATYYYVVTALTAGGETTKSNEVSYVATGTTSSVALTWTAETGASGYKVYRGTATGAENKLLMTINAQATHTYTDTGTAGTTASPPTSSTGYVTFKQSVLNMSKLIRETITITGPDNNYTKNGDPYHQ